MNALGDFSTEEQQFYEQLFTEDPNWSRSYPNFDEATRASEFLPILAMIAQRHFEEGKTNLQIIDVGCGRGWLTNILDIFGEAIGLDPVRAVVAHACEVYPHLQFVVGTPEQHAREGGAGKYDVVVCSEVIEHVPHEAQPSFLKALASLTRQGGDIILTTPRGELYPLWRETALCPQPIEAWLTEDQLTRLVAQCGLVMVSRRQFFPISLGGKETFLLHASPFRRLFSVLNYVPEYSHQSTIYQIVWLRTA